MKQRAASAGQMRLHLQFESGQVLPIEMPREAARALARALNQTHAGDLTACGDPRAIQRKACHE